MPGPADNLTPMESAANRSKPPAGIVCPDCLAPLHGTMPAACAKRIRKAKGKRYRPRFVVDVTHGPGSIRRVRQCPRCGRKVLTGETVLSYRV